MPTALNRRIIDQDLSSYMVEGRLRARLPLPRQAALPKDGQRWALEHIEERNAITREVCAKLGVRLIDLAAALATENQADFRENFLDAVHIRPRAFRRVAAIIHNDINDLVI